MRRVGGVYRVMACIFQMRWCNLRSMAAGIGPVARFQGHTMTRVGRGVTVGVLAAMGLVFGLAATPAAAIETIDCGKDTRLAERTICASQRLQILDAVVVQAYADVMLDAVVSDRIKNRVKWSQRAFLRDRDGCGDDRRCLEASMQAQLERLRRSVN
jgi:uncharacterized protein YecT (DUF1311 family)